jgi:hypothetical protein
MAQNGTSSSLGGAAGGVCERAGSGTIPKQVRTVSSRTPSRAIEDEVIGRFSRFSVPSART